MGRSVDGDRHDRHPGLQSDLANAPLGLAQVPAPRAAALRVHQHRAAAVEDGVRGDERLLVVMPAPNWEDAPVLEDVLDGRVLEELRFGHELGLSRQVDRGEEMVHLAEVVRRQDGRAGGGDVLHSDRAGPVEEDGRDGEDHAHEVIDPANTFPRALVVLREDLRGPRVLVDLRLHVLGIHLRHLFHPVLAKNAVEDGAPVDSYPLITRGLRAPINPTQPCDQPRDRATASRQRPTSSSRSDSGIAGS